MSNPTLPRLAVLAALVCALPLTVSADARSRYKADTCRSAEGKVIPCDQAKKAEAPPARYPNATRVAPEFPKSKIGKQWDTLVEAATATPSDANATIAAAQVVLANPDASRNEKSEAAYHIAIAYLSLDNRAFAEPVKYLQQAIAIDGLNNNQHYSGMLLLSQMLLGEQKYEQSLQYADRFAKETGVEDLAVLRVQGNDLYRLNRYAQAVPVLEKAYALDKGADPNLGAMLADSYNKTNQKAKADALVAQAGAGTQTAGVAEGGQVQQLLVLANTKQYAKAAALFDSLQAQGQIGTHAAYEAGYVSYLNQDGKEAKAAKIIDEGLAKGIIVPDATVYNLLGQANYYSNNPEAAIQAWRKGEALAKDGEQNRMLAQLYCEEGRYAECKAQAEKALQRGTKDKGAVYLSLAEAESEDGLNNRAAMIAALKEAAKYPEYQAEANNRLKQAGAK